MDDREKIQEKEKTVLEVKKEERAMLPTTELSTPTTVTGFPEVHRLKTLIQSSIVEGMRSRDISEDMARSVQVLQDVKMSAPIKRQGTQINIIQCVQINETVINNMMDMLKTVDSLEERLKPMEGQDYITVAHEEIEIGPTIAYRKLILDRTTLKEFKNTTVKSFVEEVMKRSETMKDAAEFLNIERSYLYSLIEKYGIDRSMLGSSLKQTALVPGEQ